MPRHYCSSLTPQARSNSKRRSSPAAASGASSRISTRCRASSQQVSGYTGGKTKDPTYRQVTAGGTGHYEAVEITYDPAKVSYEALLTAFWHSVDPTDGGGQFCDRGQSYETAVFAANEKERSLAEASKKAAQKRVDKPIVTPILAAKPFYAAEDYHQDYYTNNPLRYRYYRFSCGRDSRVKEIWGKHAYEGIPGHG